MSSAANNSAIMTIDLKRNRFRIHKATLSKMGNPRYIQFLINPEEMFLAILGSDKPLAGGTANRVNWVHMPNKSVEFYSITLLAGVLEMIGLLDFRYSYRLTGEIDMANRVAYFSMKTLKKFERSAPDDGKRVRET